MEIISILGFPTTSWGFEFGHNEETTLWKKPFEILLYEFYVFVVIRKSK